MKDYTSGEDLYEKEDSINFFMFMTNDPTYFEEVLKEEKWRVIMDVEMETTRKNNTWELIELPVEAKHIVVKWIYKTK